MDQQEEFKKHISEVDEAKRLVECQTFEIQGCIPWGRRFGGECIRMSKVMVLIICTSYIKFAL